MQAWFVIIALNVEEHFSRSLHWRKGEVFGSFSSFFYFNAFCYDTKCRKCIHSFIQVKNIALINVDRHWLKWPNLFRRNILQTSKYDTFLLVKIPYHILKNTKFLPQCYFHLSTPVLIFFLSAATLLSVTIYLTLLVQGIKHQPEPMSKRSRKWETGNINQLISLSKLLSIEWGHF